MMNSHKEQYLFYLPVTHLKLLSAFSSVLLPVIKDMSLSLNYYQLYIMGDYHEVVFFILDKIINLFLGLRLNSC